MKMVTKSIKKVVVSVVLSTILISSLATSVYASIEPSRLLKQIGNELKAEFNVVPPDAVDTVVISWDDAALEIDMESYDLTKDVAKNVNYYVTPGVDNDDELTVSVLLKVPTASVTALTALEVDGAPISSEFSEAGFDYHVLHEGLPIAPEDPAYAGSFDITFNAVTAGIPFTASLIAIEEAQPVLLKAPVFNQFNMNGEVGMQIFHFESPDATPEWSSAVQTISYKFDGEEDWTVIPNIPWTIERNGEFYDMTISHGTDSYYNRSYLIKSTGYEDIILKVILP